MTPLIKGMVGIPMGLLVGFIVSHWFPEEIEGFIVAIGVIVGGFVGLLIWSKEELQQREQTSRK